jgi:nitrous oxidase accessory protein
MNVSDVRFGGELQSRSGRLHTFDAVECLASFYIDASERNDVRAVWVSDFETGRLVPADSALFLRGGRVQSPMGRAIVAFDARGSSADKRAQYGSGDLLRWTEVVAFMSAQRFVPVADSAHAHDHPGVHLTRTDTIVVDRDGAVPTIAAALAHAGPGAHVIVRPGIYREPTLTIAVPLTLEGDGATLDGEGAHGLIVVAADDVTVRGLVLRNTGASRVEDRAALRVEGRHRCTIERNRVEDALFAIYLSGVSDCTVRDNVILGEERYQSLSGNGIHVWQSERVHLLDNRVRGHRDGIYFEFVKNGDVRGNVIERNQRYSLHFMFSDDCQYAQNVFRQSGAGVAVMYTRRVHMLRNRFEHNWGSSTYGLLLKDINESEIVDNVFIGNSVALHLEGSNGNRIAGNEFSDNGWALRVLANAQDNRITGNAFIANSFDVATNSRQNFSTFTENYWDRYRGYDLDRDGIGDVPHAPVRLFALVVEQSPPALVLQRSVIVDLLDIAERVLPVLTPATLIDERPLMRRPGAGASGS